MRPEIIDIMCDRRLGFITRYTSGTICCSVVLYGTREIIFYKRPNTGQKGFLTEIGSKTSWKVSIDQDIEDLDVYHSQYGVSISENHTCFFIGSWVKGLYCCDINTGKLIWRYNTKHCNEVYVYDEYLVARFTEIGLRKLSYDGNELGGYTITTSNVFSQLEDQYVFVGPKRDKFFIIDTITMDEVRIIKDSLISKHRDSLLLLDASGKLDNISIVGFENEIKFERNIIL